MWQGVAIDEKDGSEARVLTKDGLIRATTLVETGW
jgi:hypothetical protein